MFQYIYCVHAWGSRRSHIEGKCVNCRELTQWWSLYLTHCILIPATGWDLC